jgi:hypothetical protein
MKPFKTILRLQSGTQRKVDAITTEIQQETSDTSPVGLNLPTILP